MLKEILLATRNPDKGAELAALLSDLGVRIRTLDEFPEAPEVEEDGETCEENAIKKARTIAHATGIVSIADDTGLEVEALDGRPGVHAARYAGDHATYDDNCRKLLRELEGVPGDRRRARFITVAALASPWSNKVDVVEGTLDGVISDAPVGKQGFGYDPVFFVPELGRTLAQLTAEEKNQISHRGRAFAKVKTLLSSIEEQERKVGA